jgi:hypothetical protein
MNFCPKCGRQRTGSNRFCSGCGNDFGEPAADSGTPLAAEPIAQVPLTTAVPITAAATRPEPMPAADLAHAAAPPQASAEPDPFASAFEDPSPGGEPTLPRGEPTDQWATANTIYAEPAQATGYPPSSQPASAFPPPAVHGSTRRRFGGGKRAVFIVVAVLVALAAGGGAYALVSRPHGHTTAQPTDHPTVATRPSTTAPTTQTSATASPSGSPSASATPSPPQTATAQVAPGVASNPAAPAVEAYLNRYFNSINTRNYGEYNSLLDAQMQQSDSQSGFDSGFATSKDSAEMLTGITDTGGGNLTANVSFTSHQNLADSIDQSACNNWQISLYLVPQGNSYVMTAAPADYTAAYTDC